MQGEEWRHLGILLVGGSCFETTCVCYHRSSGAEKDKIHLILVETLVQKCFLTACFESVRQKHRKYTVVIHPLSIIQSGSGTFQLSDCKQYCLKSIIVHFDWSADNILNFFVIWNKDAGRWWWLFRSNFTQSFSSWIMVGAW